MMKNVAELLKSTVNNLQISGEGSSQNSINHSLSVKALRFCAMLLLLCLGVGQMWGNYALPGDIKVSWWDKDANDMGVNNTITFYAVPANTYSFQLISKGSWDNKWANWENSDDDPNFNLTWISSEENGGNGPKIQIEVLNECDITVTVTDHSNKKVTISSSAPTYRFRYDWAGTGGGTNWSGTLVSNLDGTYSCTGKYNAYAEGFWCEQFSSNNTTDNSYFTGWKAASSITLENNPQHEDDCIFTYDPADNSLTIRKCNTISQHDNGQTGTNYIYFYNADANWIDTYLYFVIGRPEYSKMYRISQITNTKVWRAQIAYNANPSSEWYDAGYYAIAGGASAWDNGTGWGPASLTGWNHYSAPYLDPFNLRRNYYYVIEKENADDGGAITMTEKTQSYTSLNCLTVGYKYNIAGTDMTSGSTPAQISMSSNYYTGGSAVAAKETQTIITNTSGTYAKSHDATAYGGAVGLSISSLSDGYTFSGWYVGSTLKEDNTSYTYYPNRNTTVTAKFDYRWSLKGSMSASWDVDNFIGDFAQNGSGQDVGYIDLSLNGNTDYNFKIYDRLSGAWYSFSNSDVDVTRLTYTNGNDVEQTCGTGNGYKANSGIKTAAPGTYRFTWNADTKKLTVTYPDSYLVTYNGNDNSIGNVPTDEVYYAPDATVTVKGNPLSLSKTGYDALAYWNRADDGSGAEYAISSGTFTITDDVTLYAKWTQDVTLDKEDGTSPESVGVTYKSATLGSMTNPTRTGYTFGGYYTGDNGTGDLVISTGKALQANVTGYTGAGGIWTHDGATTLHAKWTETPRTITASAGEGGSVGSTGYTAYIATTCAITAAPANDGYKFKVWRETGGTSYVTFADSTSASTTITATGNASIKAVFEHRWSIAGQWKTLDDSNKWDADYYTMGTITQDGDDYICSKDITLPANTTYTFKVVDRVILEYNNYSWYGLPSSTSYITYTTENLPWSLGTGDEGPYECGIITAGAGTYTFTWNITKKKLSVVFPPSWLVTTVMNPASGAGTVTPTGYVAKTESYAVEATPYFGYDFTGWTVSDAAGTFDEDEDPSTTFTPTADATVTANFARRYAFIEGKFRVYDSNRNKRTMVGTAGGVGNYNSMSIPMTYDETNHRFYCHTYSTLDELKEISSREGAYFLIQTSTSPSSWVDMKLYGAYAYDKDAPASRTNNLSTKGDDNGREVTNNNRTFYFTGTEDGYVIIYFDGEYVWYELEYLESSNFVIYRTGDKAGDSRALIGDVESYDGGTIDKPIEFRMKVRELDTWYSLYLPFIVDSVCVWDNEDAKYYKLGPYYRTGGKFYTGDYIIRTPEATTDFALVNFGNWNDPDHYDDYVPSANTPYIIQWHDNPEYPYYRNKYISFFGATGQTIPTAFSKGSAPGTNNVVNVYGNNTMRSGTVTDAYLLEGDYGGGAWLREAVGTERTILPFECFIRASETSTALYQTLQRGMMIVDTPTGIGSVAGNPSSDTRKVIIDNQMYILRGENMYTIQGVLVK